MPRLAAYWAEVMGGLDSYSLSCGDQPVVLRMHAGNGDMSDLGERFLRCFRAADEADLPADRAFRGALHEYMRWAVDDMLSYSAHDAVVAPSVACLAGDGTCWRARPPDVFGTAPMLLSRGVPRCSSAHWAATA